MSLRTPIFTTLPWAKAASGSRAARARSREAIRMTEALLDSAGEALHTEIRLKLREAGLETVGRNLVHHAPAVHHVMAVSDGGGEFQILLHEQDGEPLGLQAADGGADLLDDDGGQPLGGLVEEEQPCAGAEDPPDGEHLLFAARELGPLAV